ncbi:MAG: hypothetical protein AseanaTS_16340 [Candidatus Pelagadaptatus aseana]|uniref:DUF2069 domain-containing protein n=1 Tax=Candidatus Pelagadaptatus aseana TaxID=3120508 RepID=UPI0039B2A178
MNDKHTATAKPMPQNLLIGRFISYACLFGLLALYTYSALIEDEFVVVLWLVPCASIAIFLPGMIINNHRTYSWLCFAILLHFTVGVNNAMAPNGQFGDYIQIALSTILFISAMMTSRWLQAWQHDA